MHKTTDGKDDGNVRLTLVRISFDIICGGVFLVTTLVAPYLVGWYAGHGWGLVVVMAEIGGWLYMNHKYFRGLALSTRLIWYCFLAYILLAGVVEGTRFFDEAPNEPNPSAGIAIESAELAWTVRRELNLGVAWPTCPGSGFSE